MFGLLFVAAACGDDSNESVADSQPAQTTTSTTDLAEVAPGVAATWVNQTGLTADASDPDLWSRRLTEACNAPIWDDDAAEDLVSGYITEDGGDPSNVEFRENAAAALWTMAVNTCRDLFPEEAIAAGPIFDFG